MATTNRVYVLAAFFFSAIGAVFNIVSLGTEYWINGQAVDGTSVNSVNYINYGLFQGNYNRKYPASTIYQITMTCSFKNNVCALLCGKDASARSALLDSLYQNEIDPAYAYDNCPKVLSRTYHYFMSFHPFVKATSSGSVSHSSFMNAGVWLSTIIFLVLATLIGLFASVLALYNTVTNPIQYLLSVRSLFYYNAAAFCCTVMSIILWGSMYNITIFHNVGIYDTLEGSFDSNKMAHLGYSYWIQFIPLVFFTASITILYYREYLNARDPKQQKVNLDVDSSDPNLYLY